MRIVTGLNTISGSRFHEGDVLDCDRSSVVSATAITAQTVDNDGCINSVVGAIILLTVDGELEVGNFIDGDGFATDIVNYINSYFTTNLLSSVYC